MIGMWAMQLSLLVALAIGGDTESVELAPKASISPDEYPFNYPEPPREGQADYFVIGQNGRARCVIVHSDTASSAVRKSARGLAKYLELVVGEPFAVSPEGATVPTGMNAIHIGDTATAQRLPLCLPSVRYGDDAMPNLNGYMVMTTSRRTLVIRGQTDASVNHGVVGLLKRYVGVRQFWPGAPGAVGDVIPKRPNLTIPQLEWLDWPYYYSRTMSMGPFASGQAPLDFFRRQRTLPAGENYPQWLPGERYGQSNPEYYSLVGGQRMVPQDNRPRGWQPCCSNPEVARVMADNVIQYFRDNPEAVGINVSINDGGRDCQCEDCRAMDAPDRTMSDRYVKFTNQICEYVSREFPAKSIVYLAYGAAQSAPQNVELHPMLLPVLTSTTALRSWDEWSMQGAARMGMYFHHDDDFMFVLPKLDMHEIARKLRYAAASGRARVFYMEAHPIWPLSGVVPLVTSEILWDPRQDVDAVLDDYYATFFGLAAQPMKAYYQTLMAGYDRWRQSEGDPHPTGPDVVATKYNRRMAQFGALTPEEARVASAALVEAAAAAGSDQQVSERVQLIRWMFGLVELAVEQWAVTQRLNSEPIRSEADASRAVQDARRGLQLSRQMKEYVADTLKQPPAVQYRPFLRGPNVHHKNDMYDRLASGVPNPEVGAAIAAGTEAAADFLREQLGSERAAQWFFEKRSVEREPEMIPVLEYCEMRSAGINLENLVIDSGFEQIGQQLAPDDLAPDRQIVLNPEQQRRLGLRLWFPERTDCRIVLDDQESHSGRYSLMIENCFRARLTKSASAVPGDRVRLGVWFKHSGEQAGRYKLVADAMGPGIDGVVTLAALQIEHPADQWRQLMLDVVVPPGASRVSLRVFAESQAIGARCWIDDLFIGKNPASQTGTE